MDVEDIRDEVDEFNEDYFIEYLDLIDDNFDFIEENELVVPKKNYLFTYNFLNFTMGHFSNLDYKFVSPTLRKLHNDILMLHKNLEKQKEFKNEIDSIFEIFLKSSQMFVDIKNALKSKFALSDSAIQKLNEWFNNEENFDDIKMLAEYLLQGLHPKNEEEFCSYSVDTLTTQIGNAKKNVYFLKIKEYRASIARQLFGDKIEQMNTQTYYRILNIISYALVLYIKKLICKKV
jgi:hypothetical protein